MKNYYLISLISLIWIFICSRSSVFIQNSRWIEYELSSRWAVHESETSDQYDQPRQNHFLFRKTLQKQPSIKYVYRQHRRHQYHLYRLFGQNIARCSKVLFSTSNSLPKRHRIFVYLLHRVCVCIIIRLIFKNL